MNRIVLFFCVSVLSLVAVSADEAGAPVKHSPVPGVSDEEWAQLPPKERMMRAVGGMIPNKTTGEGNVAIIDIQGKVSAEFVRKCAERLEDVTWFRVNYSKPEPAVTFNDLEPCVKAAKGNASVVVGEFSGLPRVIVLPELHAAVVNVAALTADADDQKLKERVAKEISRAFAFCFGVFSSERPGVLDAAPSIKDLDALLVDMFTQDVVFEIERPAAKLGIKRFGRIMYKHACERGIAPPPKNKWQQRIYDEVKAQRAKDGEKGIKIEFDPKKGK